VVEAEQQEEVITFKLMQQLVEQVAEVLVV
jgi:hypothetical protein